MLFRSVVIVMHNKESNEQNKVRDQREPTKFLRNSEEDKNEPNGPCEMGLTVLYSWADKGQAQLM